MARATSRDPVTAAQEPPSILGGVESFCEGAECDAAPAESVDGADNVADTASVWATNADSSMLHPNRPTHGLPMNFVELTLSKDDPWFSNPATR